MKKASPTFFAKFILIVFVTIINYFDNFNVFGKSIGSHGKIRFG